LRDIHDPKLRSRELCIKRIQASYGYDRGDAEKVYEIMGVRRTEMLWGTACGGFAAYKVGPIFADLANSVRLFRKPWMRSLGQVGSFGFFYYLGLQMPMRLFRLTSPNNVGATHDVKIANADLVNRFRLF